MILGLLKWRWVLVGLAAAVMLGLILLLRAQLELEKLKADQALTKAAGYEAELQLAAEAAKVHRAHVERMEQQNKAWEQTILELQSMEGRDAPLSDHMRAAGKRLWSVK